MHAIVQCMSIMVYEHISIGVLCYDRSRRPHQAMATHR
jgi:hypothetical protein